MLQPRDERFPPGPPQRRGGVIGDIAYVVRFMRDPMGFVGDRFRRYGDIYYAPTKDGGLYVIKHPDHLREVLAQRSADFSKQHSGFERFQEVVGEGLLTTDGEVWRRQRRMVQPAFTKKRMAGYAEAMVEETQSSLAEWHAGDERDMSDEMMELTLRIVARTLFTHDVRDEADDVRGAMTAFQDVMARPDVLPAWLSPGRRKLERALASLDSMIARMIAERRAMDPTDAPQDLLQTLVTAVDDEGDGAGMSEREVRDQLVTLYLAGHETTSHALTWTLYLLSQNRDAEVALCRELHQVLAGRPPTFADLPQLPYTEQVIKEAMRIYPPAFMVTRRAVRDTQIGGYGVPAGAEIACWLYQTHHDPRWFPSPRQFRPARFSPENAAKLPKMAYLPFGGGPRACIGAAFAMTEATLILGALVQRFGFSLAPDQKIGVKPRITLVPKYGMRMRLRSR